jgi:hypothetical protein
VLYCGYVEYFNDRLTLILMLLCAAPLCTESECVSSCVTFCEIIVHLLVITQNKKYEHLLLSPYSGIHAHAS